MPVPNNISELSTTPGSNSPAGSDPPSVLDDHQRTAYAFIKQISDSQVSLSGNQTIAGVKTFSSAPVLPADSIATAAIQNDSVTFPKLQNIATASILGRSTAGTGDVEVLTGAQATALLVAASETVSGRVELATDAEAATGTDATRAVTPASLRGGLNATGTAPIYACRAWVNFNGTGTVAIRASGNVSSITDNGVGDYTVNFTNAMPDANYAAVGLATIGGNRLQVLSLISQTSAGVRVNTGYAGGNTDQGVALDQTIATVAIFR